MQVEQECPQHKGNHIDIEHGDAAHHEAQVFQGKDQRRQERAAFRHFQLAADKIKQDDGYRGKDDGEKTPAEGIIAE